MNGIPIEGTDGTTLASEYFFKGDQVSVVVEVSDGELVASSTQSLTISDAPPIFYVSGAPEAVAYGVPISFPVTAEDPDGDEVTLEFLGGPNGMQLDDDGVISWTPTGPMFDTRQTVHWKLSMAQGDIKEVLSGRITIVDEDRQSPLTRSGIRFDNSGRQSIASGDFSGDQTHELLVADDAQSLYTIGFDGSGYEQNWMYPFILEPGGKISCVASGDIDNDQIDEIFVGFDNSNNFGSEDKTKILVLDGKSRRVRQSIDIDASLVTAIRIGDVNNDGHNEIISLVRINPYGDDESIVEIRSHDTANVLWQSSFLAQQSDLAIGDTDGDGTDELVLNGGYIFGFNGDQFANEWFYGESFGYQVRAADIDGDDIDEVIGNSNNSSAPGLNVYDAVNKTVKGQLAGRYSDFSASDVDGDKRSEILAIPYAENESALYSFNQDTTSNFSADWTLNLSSAASKGLIADMDGDGEQEYVIIHPRESPLIVAGENPEIEIEWQGGQRVDGQFSGGEQAEFSHDGSRLIFFNRGSRNALAIQMDPLSGDLKWTMSLGAGTVSTFWDIALSDIGQDGNPELHFINRQTLSMYDFFSDSIVWSSTLPDYGRAIAEGRLNEVYKSVLAIVTDDGRLQVYDPNSQTLLWEALVEGGKSVMITDFDGDLNNEIIVTTNDTISRYALVDGNLTLVQQQTMAQIAPLLAPPEYVSALQEAYINKLAVGDLDSDGRQELLFTAAYEPEVTWLVVLNHDLSPRSAYRHSGDIGSLLVQNYGTGRRNILISSGSDLLNNTHSQILELAPDSFMLVSESPYLPFMQAGHGLQFVDTNNDGIPELSYSNYFSMNVTR